MTISVYDPAFARPAASRAEHSTVEHHGDGGLNQRDYTAIHICAALASRYTTEGAPSGASAFATEIADWAYTLTDAMIARSFR